MLVINDKLIVVNGSQCHLAAGCKHFLLGPSLMVPTALPLSCHVRTVAGDVPLHILLGMVHRGMTMTYHDLRLYHFAHRYVSFPCLKTIPLPVLHLPCQKALFDETGAEGLRAIPLWFYVSKALLRQWSFNEASPCIDQACPDSSSGRVYAGHWRSFVALSSS